MTWAGFGHQAKFPVNGTMGMAAAFTFYQRSLFWYRRLSAFQKKVLIIIFRQDSGFNSIADRTYRRKPPGQSADYLHPVQHPSWPLSRKHPAGLLPQNAQSYQLILY